jgi:hypothetical protein
MFDNWKEIKLFVEPLNKEELSECLKIISSNINFVNTDRKINIQQN